LKVYEKMPRPEKKEYLQDIPVIIGVGIAFLAFATITLISPISDWIHAWVNWLYIFTYLFYFCGVICIAVGIALLYQNKRLRGQVMKAINAGDYGARTKLDDLAADFNLNSGDARRLLVDLRMARELKVSFDSKTGEIIFPTLGNPALKEESNGYIYCSFCGLQLNKDTLYCPSCGANIH
jgi:hypothetical protein